MQFPRSLRAVSFGLVALAVLASPFVLSAQAVPAKGDPAKGKPLFVANCVACHKADGTGGIKLTGNVTPNWKDPKIWKDPARAKGDDFMRDCIVNGKVKSGMVSWKTKFKPAQIEDLIAYINTLAKRK